MPPTMEEINQRNSYLLEINSLVKRCNAQLDSLVSSIGWTSESLTKTSQDEEDHLDENLEVQAKTTPELTSGSSKESKDLETLYNEFLSNLPNHPNKNEDKTKTQTLTELLEIERNAKRRRISYKNKVHTKNKSHTEVLRALVHEQMEVLKVASELPDDENAVKKDVIESENGGLIQIDVSSGNPHLVWRTIPNVLKMRRGEGESNDKRNSTKERKNRYCSQKEDRDSGRKKDLGDKGGNKVHSRRRGSDEINVRLRRSDKYTKGDSSKHQSKESKRNDESKHSAKTKAIGESFEESSSSDESHRSHQHKRKKSSKKSRDHQKHKRRKQRS